MVYVCDKNGRVYPVGELKSFTPTGRPLKPVSALRQQPVTYFIGGRVSGSITISRAIFYERKDNEVLNFEDRAPGPGKPYLPQKRRERLRGRSRDKS